MRVWGLPHPYAKPHVAGQRSHGDRVHHPASPYVKFAPDVIRQLTVACFHYSSYACTALQRQYCPSPAA